MRVGGGGRRIVNFKSKENSLRRVSDLFGDFSACFSAVARNKGDGLQILPLEFAKVIKLVVIIFGVGKCNFFFFN